MDADESGAELSRQVIDKRQVRDRFGPRIGNGQRVGHVVVSERTAGGRGRRTDRLGQDKIGDADVGRIVRVPVAVGITLGEVIRIVRHVTDDRAGRVGTTGDCRVLQGAVDEHRGGAIGIDFDLNHNLDRVGDSKLAGRGVQDFGRCVSVVGGGIRVHGRSARRVGHVDRRAADDLHEGSTKLSVQVFNETQVVD